MGSWRFYSYTILSLDKGYENLVAKIKILEVLKLTLAKYESSWLRKAKVSSWAVRAARWETWRRGASSTSPRAPPLSPSTKNTPSSCRLGFLIVRVVKVHIQTFNTGAFISGTAINL